MKRLILVAMVTTLLAAMVGSAFAAGQSTIRISPALPVKVVSPATFEIWIEGAAQPATNDPHILLVMTEASHSGLTGDVVVNWTDVLKTSFSPSDFIAVNTGSVPPSGSTEGGRYTVASLQGHLGVPHSEMIYYAYGPFLSRPINQTRQAFTVTLPSTAPKMLVYAIGKTGSSNLFNNKVPNTIPGFMILELGPLLLALASFSAFALHAVKHKKVKTKDR